MTNLHSYLISYSRAKVFVRIYNNFSGDHTQYNRITSPIYNISMAIYHNIPIYQHEKFKP